MRSTRRIGFLLAIVFLMPALFFSVYEISSLNKDEEMIQNIYNKQLEAILFSVNQYSDDILNSWMAKIEMGLSETEDDSMPTRIESLLNLNSSLKLIFIYDTIAGKPVQKTFSLDEDLKEKVRSRIDSTLSKSGEQIRALVSYKKSGFQKLDIVGRDAPGQFLVFISNGDQEKMKVVGLLLDQDVFIQDMIGPRLQVIAKDKFILSAFNKWEPSPVYSTHTLDSAALASEAVTKDFWLFPDYSLGIRSEGGSLKEIVRERTSTNLILLVVLDVVLIVAVIFVFKNVKDEVQLAQNKSDFVSNVSHEIRTPLALISMFAETLEMGRITSEEKKKEYYTIINKEAQRLSGIVNKILNFSQTEANKKVLHITTVDTQSEIYDILYTYDFHLKNKGFEYQFTPSPHLNVLADKEAFTEVFINLIDNAIKYSPEKKLIQISTHAVDGFGAIVIKDYGMGISKEDQKHIFDKFYRVPSGNLAKSRGTGLGLTLVKQLVENQKGKIAVSSEPGKGSVFTVYFPIAKN